MHAPTHLWRLLDKPPTVPFLVQDTSQGRYTASSIRAGSTQRALFAAVAMLQGPCPGKLFGWLGGPSSKGRKSPDGPVGSLAEDELLLAKELCTSTTNCKNESLRAEEEMHTVHVLWTENKRLD